MPASERVAENPVSTFSIDVDTGAYSNVRRMLNTGRLPARDSVRVEEMINFLSYDYPMPKSDKQPFAIYTEVGPTPWNEITLTGGNGKRIDALRYTDSASSNKLHGSEIALRRLRYNQPDGDASKLIESTLKASEIKSILSDTGDIFRFGTSVNPSNLRQRIRHCPLIERVTHHLATILNQH